MKQHLLKFVPQRVLKSACAPILDPGFAVSHKYCTQKTTEQSSVWRSRRSKESFRLNFEATSLEIYSERCSEVSLGHNYGPPNCRCHLQSHKHCTQTPLKNHPCGGHAKVKRVLDSTLKQHLFKFTPKGVLKARWDIIMDPKTAVAGLPGPPTFISRTLPVARWRSREPPCTKHSNSGADRPPPCNIGLFLIPSPPAH